MLSLKDIRQYISDLGFAEDDRVYIGKLDNKKEKSIGVYSRQDSGAANIPLGGMQNASYDIKKISLLIHWNKSKDETEQTATMLFEKLLSAGSFDIGNIHIFFIRPMVNEPKDVGTDDAGVFEYVIWLDFIYERNGGNA